MSQVARGAALQAEWESQLRARGATRDAGARRRVGRRVGGQAAARRRARRCARSTGSKDKLATRVAGKEAMAAFAPFVPTMVGGAADLSELDEHRVPRRRRARTTRERQAGRNVFFGVREHGDGRGRQRHGRATAGSCGPYGSTFLQFADYMRGSIRLVGADGAAGRLGLHARLGRPRRGRPDAPAGRAPRRAARDPAADGASGPADADETAEAWRVDPRGPRRARRRWRSRARTCRSLGRGDGGVADAPGSRAAPTCCATRDDARATVVGTGAEVTVALGGRRPARRRGHPRARRLDAVAGSSSTRRTTTTATRCSRAELRLGLGRGRASRWAGSAGSTAPSAIDRFGASRPGRPGAREARDHGREHRAGRARAPGRPDDVVAGEVVLLGRAPAVELGGAGGRGLRGRRWEQSMASWCAARGHQSQIMDLAMP